MKLSELEAEVRNPKAGPVDVEFELVHLKLIQVLHQICDQLKGDVDFDLQKRFCQLVREGKMLLESKIRYYYSDRYRGGTGGKVLIDLTKLGVAALQASQSDENIQLSVSRHLDDIEKIQELLSNEKLAVAL